MRDFKYELTFRIFARCLSMSESRLRFSLNGITFVFVLLYSRSYSLLSNPAFLSSAMFSPSFLGFHNNTVCIVLASITTLIFSAFFFSSLHQIWDFLRTPLPLPSLQELFLYPAYFLPVIHAQDFL